MHNTDATPVKLMPVYGAVMHTTIWTRCPLEYKLSQCSANFRKHGYIYRIWPVCKRLHNFSYIASWSSGLLNWCAELNVICEIGNV